MQGKVNGHFLFGVQGDGDGARVSIRLLLAIFDPFRRYFYGHIDL
jgi:hypothetical protein